MFGQDQNQQDDANGQGFLNQPDVPFGAPAPGSAGPVSADDAPASDVNPFATSDPVQTDSNPVPVVFDELLTIKQEALQALTPLVGHLEQTAEEKFRTTMMMIQASDDQSLLREAYDAAKQISDEKTRAQALLDVVNEINYFTQQHHS